MAEEHCQLQGISWSDTFPFVRLFSTFKRAIAFWPMVLAFLCVTLCYVAGRTLDEIWKAADAGVLVAPRAVITAESPVRSPTDLADPTRRSEIAAYTLLDGSSFGAWKQEFAEHRERAEQAAEKAWTAEHEQQRSAVLDLIDERLEAGLQRIGADGQLSANERNQKSDELRRAADIVRVELGGYDTSRFGPPEEQATAAETILAADPDVDLQQVGEEQARLSGLLARRQQIAEAERLRPRGPFISLLNYEMRCFAAAIRGVCSGRWGFDGSVLSDKPGMLGSVASAASGVQWLVTQRPWYAAIYGVILLVIFAFFGGAICRVAAVRSARDESLSLLAALRFAGEKITALIGAPLLPAGIFVVAGFFVFIGGLIAAIPYFETIAGVIYGLALLGGVALATTFLAIVLGFHLMWPTIAVEVSDAFDAVSRAVSYVFQRAWHVGFYSFVLLLYGAVSFVVVRIIAMLLLKLTHVATGLGMNAASSAQTSTIGKLDAIWQMPAWQELPLLPATSNVNFWGAFGLAPLSGSESFAMFFIALWVFIVVGLVGAFVVSFYFCGSTEMYFLLRRSYDAVDYDDIYYEEPEEELGRGEAVTAERPDRLEQAEEPGKPEESEKPREPSQPQEPEGGGTEPSGDEPPPST